MPFYNRFFNQFLHVWLFTVCYTHINKCILIFKPLHVTMLQNYIYVFFIFLYAFILFLFIFFLIFFNQHLLVRFKQLKHTAVH